ncbi:3-hydroxyacyl-CoA dehydrogenase NAD-binding domain-containing protein [Otariodibacter sp.]|uniref:3-hydroxyacyl-CoA dehydrogenase NAD-binding domain-containing protein n=1 Tax=Otariodibacter sp. TaxID=3030919 RepID=UPI00260FA00D|nr:3-hydroxyacyl-CoA dehydrogenase NAD-binding domain-containing protein [Otariodibacter sp.]
MQQESQNISPFSVEIDHNQIAIVSIHVLDEQDNWLSESFISDLRDVIGEIIYQRAKGVIFRSTKPKCFIQGYNLSKLQDKTEAQLLALTQDAQAVMREINTLKMPVIAVIDGACFGLGLELALACDYRIASEEHYTQFAMPQVRSGILPFAGGTQRLPRLIGLANAASLLISGNKINVERALQLGLVDRLIPSSNAFEIAYQLLLNDEVAKVDYKNSLTRIRKWKKNLLGNPVFREYYLNFVENRLWNRSFDNYPAMPKILSVLKEPHFKAGLALEQQAFVELFFTEQSQVLVNLKKSEQSMRYRYQATASGSHIKQVSILGSGYMGAGIAYLTANNAKLPVRIKDIHPTEIQRALQNSYELMKKEVDRKILSHGEMIQRMNLITGGDRLIAVKDTDFIVEAVYENLSLKQQMVEESEGYYSEDTIFASNTSTFSISEIASVAKRPENIVGFHYFSPVTKRKMIEIVPHAQTSEKTISKAIYFALKQGKLPIVVADQEGFFINRILTPFLLEAIQCLIDGEGIEFIDQSLEEFGFRTGPLAMIDDMGLDVIVKSNAAMVNKLGKRFSLPEGIQLLIMNERKGRKNKRGFYLYDTKGNRTQEDKSIYQVMETIMRNNMESQDIARRCILRMINEACWCLQDNVITSKEEGNVASVLGVDFPDFRGGIYAYIEEIGAKEIVKQLRRHAALYGDRFHPCDWLLQQAGLN